MIFSASGRPSLIVPITGTTTQKLLEEAVAAENAGADVIEWRIDFLIAAHANLSFATIGREVISPILAATQIPLLLTIRTHEEGGQVKLTPARYRLLIAELLDTLVHLNADPTRIGVDLEYRFKETPALAAGASNWGCTVVISYHDWHETPDNEVLYLIFEEILQIPKVVAKLAVTAQSTADVPRLLQVTAQIVQDFHRPVIALAMGEMGKDSRLQGWEYGSVATFVAVDTPSAPGQPTMEEVQAYFGN